MMNPRMRCLNLILIIKPDPADHLLPTGLLVKNGAATRCGASVHTGRLSRRNSRDINNDKLIHRTEELSLEKRTTTQRPEYVCPPIVPIQPDEAYEDLQKGVKTRG